jgi:hypothetical protein
METIFWKRTWPKDLSLEYDCRTTNQRQYKMKTGMVNAKLESLFGKM